MLRVATDWSGGMAGPVVRRSLPPLERWRGEGGALVGRAGRAAAPIEWYMAVVSAEMGRNELNPAALPV